MQGPFQVVEIGVVEKTGEKSTIKIDGKYKDALSGLGGFSHLIVCYWFHKNDIPEKRGILKVHPRKDKRNPLTGVFATHSPVRPNLIAISICGLVGIEDNIIYLDEIDAFDGTPVIDIKPYIPSDAPPSPEIKVPKWV